MTKLHERYEKLEPGKERFAGVFLASVTVLLVLFLSAGLIAALGWLGFLGFLAVFAGGILVVWAIVTVLDSSL